MNNEILKEFGLDNFVTDKFPIEECVDKNITDYEYIVGKNLYLCVIYNKYKKKCTTLKLYPATINEDKCWMEYRWATDYDIYEMDGDCRDNIVIGWRKI